MGFGRLTALKEVGTLLRENMSALNAAQKAVDRARTGERQEALNDLMAEVQRGYFALQAWWLDAIRENELEIERLKSEMPQP